MRKVLDRTALKDLRLLDGTVEISVRHERRQSPSCLVQINPGGLHTGLEDHDLLSLLCQFRNFDATDPKDKIYALLNMARRGGRQPLVDVLTAVRQERFGRGCLHRRGFPHHIDDRCIGHPLRSASSSMGTSRRGEPCYPAILG